MITQVQAIIEVALICLLAMFYALFVGGCGAGFFSAKTEAAYTISPDGKTITYISTKEQQGLDLELEEVNGKPSIVKIHVDRASTAEQAIAASQAITLKLVELMQQLMPLLEKAAMAGS